MGHALDELTEPLISRFPGVFRSRINMNDDKQSTREIIKHHHFLGHHQQNVRRINGIRNRIAPQVRLNILHRLIAKKAHQTTTKSRQVWDFRHLETCLIFTDRFHRIRYPALFDDTIIFDQGEFMVLDLQPIRAGKTNNRITPPLFTTLNGLKQIAIGRIGEL